MHTPLLMNEVKGALERRSKDQGGLFEWEKILMKILRFFSDNFYQHYMEIMKTDECLTSIRLTDGTVKEFRSSSTTEGYILNGIVGMKYDHAEGRHCKNSELECFCKQYMETMVLKNTPNIIVCRTTLGLDNGSNIIKYAEQVQIQCRDGAGAIYKLRILVVYRAEERHYVSYVGYRGSWYLVSDYQVEKVDYGKIPMDKVYYCVYQQQPTGKVSQPEQLRSSNAGRSSRCPMTPQYPSPPGRTSAARSTSYGRSSYA
ncbi:hypothetical protein Ciccas_008483 [Cichlidogyrus casuarinus]|uniref:USP domain-containing protein n=1 Tax=Cichlidogyrus casuarinus TaxID=1844966 RepID=A0ABD2PZU3_9PLAT